MNYSKSTSSVVYAISRNNGFYRIDDDCIRVINLYNEKEDFMWKLFRIDTTPQETIDYWDD